MPGHEALLVNIVGHAAGALIFGIFLALLFSGRGWSGARGQYLSGLAGALALLWNLGSLVVLVQPGMPLRALSLIAAISFSVLSLLPAVLLHLWLMDGQRPIVIGGYVLSSTAVAMHFWELRGNGAALHQQALLLMTIGFLALTGAALAGVALGGGSRRTAGGGRLAASMSLALFAMSFVHFGSGHATQAWSSELFVHHAGIPLALFILLQDYRFVLLDAFVRFLANALLAAVLAWLALGLASMGGAARDPVRQSISLIGLCLLLIVFAGLRSLIQAWLTRAVFAQGGVLAATARLKSAGGFSNDEEYLTWAANLLADAVRAEWATVVRQSALEGAGVPVPAVAGPLAAWKSSDEGKRAEALVPLRLMQGDSRMILLGRRRGGQRYLRDDLDALAVAAAEMAAHVESMRREEMARLVAQAELRALQSQINPHFLFNALNTVYGTIPREAAAARKMVLNLAEIFRYFLQTDRPLVPLSEEMQIVRAYLEVEQVRLGSRLTVEFDIDEAASAIAIPVLSLQPLVENAIKHGVAQRTEPGYVRMRARCEDGELHVRIENSGGEGVEPKAGPGVGLQNVRRRLEICYGRAATLELSVTREAARADVRIPLDRAVHRL